VLYADMRGELGGESGMNRFPSTIGTFKDWSWEFVKIWSSRQTCS
jgi:hypothetical protein